MISNPGCYATSIQALIAPLIPYLSSQSPPTVFGISGYSGAGTKAAPSGSSSSSSSSSDTTSGTVPKISPEDLKGGIRPYSLTDHIHEREASRQLQQLCTSPSNDFKVAFIPAVAPWFQGIISTVSAPLNKSMTAKNVRETFEEFYKDNGGLVEISMKVPELEVSRHDSYRDRNCSNVLTQSELYMLLLGHCSTARHQDWRFPGSFKWEEGSCSGRTG